MTATSDRLHFGVYPWAGAGAVNPTDPQVPDNPALTMGAFVMFRRAKLHLDAIPAQVLEDAVVGGVLVARLGLTDAKGQPLCAAVRPPLVEWSALSG